MASPFPVASRTRARTKKEESFGGSVSSAKPRRREGGSLGVKGAACDVLFLGFGISGVGTESGGRGAGQRLSSVSGGLGGGSTNDDSREVIVITGSEDGSDEVISVSGSDEAISEDVSAEEEEPCDYGVQTVRKFEPNRVFRKEKSFCVDDDVGGESSKEEGADFQSHDDLIRCGKSRSFGKQSEKNGQSSGSQYDDYAHKMSQKSTPVIRDPGAHLSSDYSTSTSESSTEVDDSSDEDFIPNGMESLSAVGEYYSSSEEYVSRSEREENLERRKKGKREDNDQSSDLYCAGKNNKKLVIDDVERREDLKHGISWVNEWLQNDLEEEKEEGALNVDRCNVEIDCPSNGDNGNSGQMEERENFSMLERGGSRVTEERGRGLEDDDEWSRDEGKAAKEFDGVSAGKNVSYSNEKRKMGDVKERGNLRSPEEERLKQSRGESTSHSNVCGVDRRMEEKRYEKHVPLDSYAVIGEATSSKIEGRKERDLAMACSSQRLQKKRKHGHSSGEKESADKVAENGCTASWKSRTRRDKAHEPWLNKFFFDLADCLWVEDELLQDDIKRQNAERGKQCADDSTVREERKESTECAILTKPCEEGIEAHQVEAGKDNRRSTRDYHIRWEISGRSKEIKCFKRLSQKYNKNDASREEIVWEIPRRTEPQQEVPSIPLKFFWGDKEPEPAPKSETEKEMDKMWSDMEFSLRAGDLDSSKPSKETETTRATLCPGGKHELICDEEIGLICLFCDQIVLEMKYVLPPFLPSFEKSSVEASSTKTLPKGGNLSLFEGICLVPSGNDSVELSHHQSSSVLGLIPCDQSKLYTHQLEGFEFMWKNLAGSTDLKELSNSEPKDVGGCIISHAPGTGKTCLTILFLHTYLRLFPNSRPAVIAPASMLLTWEEEFRKWNKQWNTSISFHNLNNQEFSGSENPEAVRIVEANRHLKRCSDVMRMIKVYSWSKSSSILGISYSLYEKLAVAKRKGIKNLVKKAELEKKDEEMRKMLLDLPGVVVFDEGHTPRNQRSSIWKLLLKLRTEKRIILSGTPFQNNFLELYNTLSLVRPTTASELPPSLKKFCQTRTTQQKRAKTYDINSLVQPHDKVADEAIVNMRSIMAPFVHVHKGSILKENLPGIKECIVVLNPGERQKNIVKNIQISQCGFEYEFKLSLACIHPSLILSCNANKNEEPVISHERQKLEDLKSSTDAGVKTRFLVELIRLSEALGEKVLIFSQYKEPLSLIGDQLRSTFQWSSKGKDILHMHGSLDLRERQRLIGEFNNRKSEARVMLASTKACCEGISLVGASRVVLLDVVWNPSVERQAISRAFRIGQEKVVYTYHLIMKGTTECNKFSKQMEKERLSKMVFFPSYKENGDRKKSGMFSEDKILEKMTSNKNFKDMFDQILHQPEDSDASENFRFEAIP